MLFLWWLDTLYHVCALSKQYIISQNFIYSLTIPKGLLTPVTLVHMNLIIDGRLVWKLEISVFDQTLTVGDNLQIVGFVNCLYTEKFGHFKRGYEEGQKKIRKRKEGEGEEETDGKDIFYISA